MENHIFPPEEASWPYMVPLADQTPDHDSSFHYSGPVEYGKSMGYEKPQTKRGMGPVEHIKSMGYDESQSTRGMGSQFLATPPPCGRYPAELPIINPENPDYPSAAEHLPVLVSWPQPFSNAMITGENHHVLDANPFPEDDVSSLDPHTLSSIVDSGYGSMILPSKGKTSPGRPRRGRKGLLSPQQRERAKIVRRLRTCAMCMRRKVKCSHAAEHVPAGDVPIHGDDRLGDHSHGDLLDKPIISAVEFGPDGKRKSRNSSVIAFPNGRSDCESRLQEGPRSVKDGEARRLGTTDLYKERPSEEAAAAINKENVLKATATTLNHVKSKWDLIQNPNKSEEQPKTAYDLPMPTVRNQSSITSPPHVEKQRQACLVERKIDSEQASSVSDVDESAIDLTEMATEAAAAKVKHELVVFLMRKVYQILEAKWSSYVQYCGNSHGTHTSVTAQRSNSSQVPRSSSIFNKKRRNEDRDSDPPDDDDDEKKKAERPARRTKHSTFRFACPFNKRDPWKYCENNETGTRYQACGHSYAIIAHIKQHIKRKHQPDQCSRCGEIMDSRDQLVRHLSVDPDKMCQVIVHSPEGADQEKMRSISSHGISWEGIYDVLFPGHRPIPSPYFRYYEQSLLISAQTSQVDGGAEGLENSVRREIAGIAEANIRTLLTAHMIPVAENLAEPIIAIVQNALDSHSQIPRLLLPQVESSEVPSNNDPNSRGVTGSGAHSHQGLEDSLLSFDYGLPSFAMNDSSQPNSNVLNNETQDQTFNSLVEDPGYGTSSPLRNCRCSCHDPSQFVMDCEQCWSKSCSGDLDFDRLMEQDGNE